MSSLEDVVSNLIIRVRKIRFFLTYGASLTLELGEFGLDNPGIKLSEYFNLHIIEWPALRDIVRPTKGLFYTIGPYVDYTFSYLYNYIGVIVYELDTIKMFDKFVDMFFLLRPFVIYTYDFLHIELTLTEQTTWLYKYIYLSFNLAEIHKQTDALTDMFFLLRPFPTYTYDFLHIELTLIEPTIWMYKYIYLAINLLETHTISDVFTDMFFLLRPFPTYTYDFLHIELSLVEQTTWLYKYVYLAVNLIETHTMSDSFVDMFLLLRPFPSYIYDNFTAIIEMFLKEDPFFLYKYLYLSINVADTHAITDILTDQYLNFARFHYIYDNFTALIDTLLKENPIFLYNYAWIAVNTANDNIKIVDIITEQYLTLINLFTYTYDKVISLSMILISEGSLFLYKYVYLSINLFEETTILTDIAKEFTLSLLLSSSILDEFTALTTTIITDYTFLSKYVLLSVNVIEESQRISEIITDNYFSMSKLVYAYDKLLILLYSPVQYEFTFLYKYATLYFNLVDDSIRNIDAIGTGAFNLTLSVTTIEKLFSELTALYKDSLDNLSKWIYLSMNITDTHKIADIVSEAYLSFSLSSTLRDSVTFLFLFMFTITDSSFLSKYIYLSLNISDATTIIDSISQAYLLLSSQSILSEKITSESISIVFDKLISLEKWVYLSLNIIDTTTVIDSMSQAYLSLSKQSIITESITYLFLYMVTINDSLSSLSKYVYLSFNIADITTIVDSIANSYLLLSEQSTITEIVTMVSEIIIPDKLSELQKWLYLSLNIADITVIVDSISNNYLSFSLQSTITEKVTQLFLFMFTVKDELSALVKLLYLSINILDNTTIIEQINNEYLLFSKQSILTDAVTLVSTAIVYDGLLSLNEWIYLSINIADTVKTIDNISDNYLSFSRQSIITESITYLFLFILTINDGLSALSKYIYLSINISDTIKVIDNISDNYLLLGKSSTITESVTQLFLFMFTITELSSLSKSIYIIIKNIVDTVKTVDILGNLYLSFTKSSTISEEYSTLFLYYVKVTDALSSMTKTVNLAIERITESVRASELIGNSYLSFTISSTITEYLRMISFAIILDLITTSTKSLLLNFPLSSAETVKISTDTIKNAYHDFTKMINYCYDTIISLQGWQNFIISLHRVNSGYVLS